MSADVIITQYNNDDISSKHGNDDNTTYIYTYIYIYIHTLYMCMYIYIYIIYIRIVRLTNK